MLGNSPDAAKELTLARESTAALWNPELPSPVLLLLATGDTLELAVFLSVKMQDEAAFERNYQQLQMYVSDTRYSKRWSLLPCRSSRHLIALE